METPTLPEGRMIATNLIPFPDQSFTPVFLPPPPPKRVRTWTRKLAGAEFKVMQLGRSEPQPEIMDNPERVWDFLGRKLPECLRYNPDIENFIALFLNTRRRLIGFDILSHGTLDTILVHPREVFKSAILFNAAAVVIAHNHPSGDPTPSECDIKVTRDLMRAGQLMKIDLVDHVILGRQTMDRIKGYSSLRELGYFYLS